jgi:hypothetical protein
MKTKIETRVFKKLSIGVLSAIALLATLLGIIDNTAILVTAQDSKTTQISIISGASRLTNTVYQPNLINIKVRDESYDESNSGIAEKIIDEIVTNIVVNIRNNLGGDVDDDNNSSQGNSPSSAEFDSEIIQTGQRFSYTFNNLGTFEYYCTVHPSMVAEIVVS